MQNTTQLVSVMVEVLATTSEVLSVEQFSALQVFTKACVDAVFVAGSSRAKKAILEAFIAYTQDMLDNVAE
jgi:hypothetical protein